MSWTPGQLADYSASALSLVNDRQKNTAAQLTGTLRKLQAAVDEQHSRLALADNWYWLSQCTMTLDRQAEGDVDPIRPFPDWPYFKPLLERWHWRRTHRRARRPSADVCWKSRTMMASWLASGYIAWLGFNRRATQVVIQSEDEVRAVEIIDNIKVLWMNSLEPLKARWKVSKHPMNQPYNRFMLDNGSEYIGLPGGANKIRSYHPTIFVADEAAFMTEMEEIANNALSTRCHQILLVSSAYPGFLADRFKDCVEVPWDYNDPERSNNGETRR